MLGSLQRESYGDGGPTKMPTGMQDRRVVEEGMGKSLRDKKSVSAGQLRGKGL